MSISIETELSLLYTAINNVECFMELIGVVDRNDFRSYEGQVVFSALCALAEDEELKKLILESKVIPELSLREKISHIVKGEAELEEIMRGLFSAEYQLARYLPNWKYFLPKLRQQGDIAVTKQLAADILNKLSGIENGLTEEGDIADILSDMVRTFNDIRRKGEISDSLEKQVDGWLEYQERIVKGDRQGLVYPTGLPNLDKAVLGGIRRDSVWVLAGLPKKGKTALGIRMMSSWLKQGARIFLASIEMSYRQVISRIISQDLGIPLHLLVTGNYDYSLWEDKIKKKLEELKSRPFRIDTNGFPTIEYLQKAVDRFCFEFGGVDIIVVDYIQKAAYEGTNTAVGLGRFIVKLVAMAKKLDCGLVMLSQFHRLAKGQTIPTLADLKDTGQLEQEATMVLGIHRADKIKSFSDLGKEIEGGEEEGTFYILAQREGEGNVKIPFRWVKELAKPEDALSEEGASSGLSLEDLADISGIEEL